MDSFSFQAPAAADQPAGASDRYRLWIDGVGSFDLHLSDRVCIGGPEFGSNPADVSLLARIARRHATVERIGEGYVLEAHAASWVSGRLVEERVNLQHGQLLQLGETVRLRFQLPSALSATARLDFASDHRPARCVDGVILMADTCLLGPGEDKHVACHDWPEAVVLFRKEGQLWCRSRIDLLIDETYAPQGGPVSPGAIVCGPGLRFRVEAA